MWQGKPLETMRQCVAIDIERHGALDAEWSVRDVRGLSAWLHALYMRLRDGAAASSPSAVLLTGPPASGKTPGLTQCHTAHCIQCPVLTDSVARVHQARPRS